MSEIWSKMFVGLHVKCRLLLSDFNETWNSQLFCTMTKKCTIISQIITLLHVSTLPCHPEAACHVTQVSRMQLLQLGREWGRSEHNCLVSYLLCWRRHVSAAVGHLQVTKMHIEKNYTQYDHSIGAYCKLSTRFLCRLDYTYWAKSTSSK